MSYNAMDAENEVGSEIWTHNYTNQSSNHHWLIGVEHNSTVVSALTTLTIPLWQLMWLGV